MPYPVILVTPPSTVGGGGGSGTVTTVSSPTGEIAVATPTTTPKLEIAKVPSSAIAVTGPATVSTTSHKLTIANYELNPFGSYKATAWYGAGVTGVANALTKGSIYFVPITIYGSTAGTGLTAKTMGINIATAVATTLCRLGIYMDTGHFAPGAKILDLGTVTTATAGNKTAAITPPHLFISTQYWLACVRQGTSSTGTLKASRPTTAQVDGAGVGTSAITTAPTNGFLGYRTTATTFLSTLPATAPAIATLTTIAVASVPVLKLQSV